MKRPITNLFILGFVAAASIFIISYAPATQTNTSNNEHKISHNFRNGEKWAVDIEDALQQGGLSTAFSVLVYLYKTEPSFATNCHHYAHSLGRATYALLAQNKSLELSPETAYCGYGFYHGLMEEMIIEEESAQKAGQFCDDNRNKIAPALYDACYHGIGHGALSYSASDPVLWSRPHNLIDDAIKLCKEASNKSGKTVWRCASGVFMELGNYYITGQYGLKINKRNPYEICSQQISSIALPCYTQMNGIVAWLTDRNLRNGLKYVKKIKVAEYAREATQTLSASSIDITNIDHAPEIESCRSTKTGLRNYCIRGLALAFMLRGNPGKEYEEAITFCKSNGFDKSEQRECLYMILAQSKAMYPEGAMKGICSKIPENEYKADYCRNE